MSITHAFSFGGGVQSTACLVLAATGRLPEYRHFVMADVGADSENPATIDYVEHVAKPYAEKNGLAMITVQRRLKDGTPESNRTFSMTLLKMGT